LVQLPGIARKAEHDPAARSHNALDCAQSGRGIRPDLHGVDRQRLIKGVVGERQALRRSAPQVDTTVLDGDRIPGARLLTSYRSIPGAGTTSGSTEAIRWSCILPRTVVS
jgi:hypothetical protein